MFINNIFVEFIACQSQQPPHLRDQEIDDVGIHALSSLLVASNRHGDGTDQRSVILGGWRRRAGNLIERDAIGS